MEATPSRFKRICFCPSSSRESTAFGKDTLLPPNLRPIRILPSASRIVTFSTRRSLMPILVIGLFAYLELQRGAHLYASCNFRKLRASRCFGSGLLEG